MHCVELAVKGEVAKDAATQFPIALVCEERQWREIVFEQIISEEEEPDAAESSIGGIRPRPSQICQEMVVVDRAGQVAHEEEERT